MPCERPDVMLFRQRLKAEHLSLCCNWKSVFYSSLLQYVDVPSWLCKLLASSVLWRQGGPHGVGFLLELKCLHCLFVQPCDMIYVHDTSVNVLPVTSRPNNRPNPRPAKLIIQFQPHSTLPSLLPSCSFCPIFLFVSSCFVFNLMLSLFFIFLFLFQPTPWFWIPLHKETW